MNVGQKKIILNTARCYVALAYLLNSKYYKGQARRCLALYYKLLRYDKMRLVA